MKSQTAIINNHMPIIVVACDSFKGSLSSAMVADAVAEGVRSVLPHAEVRSLTIADGGEGTMDALIDALHGERVTLSVTGPLGEPVMASYGWVGSRKLALIELAQAAGLTLVPPDRRNPLFTTTYGVGRLMLDALSCGAEEMIVSLGGSATNDAAMGLLTALGARFLDGEGRALLGTGEMLERVRSIDMSGLDPRLGRCEISLACDVDSPFYGSAGAAQVFAPQKGADAMMTMRLDNGMRSFASVVMQTTGCDISTIPGAGAAGGVAGGLVGLLGAKICQGIELVLDAVGFDEALRGASFVITGEGSIDAQTLRGKAPMGVLRRALRQSIPTIVIAGRVADPELLLQAGFAALYPIADPSTPLALSMQPDIARRNILHTTAHLLHELVG